MTEEITPPDPLWEALCKAEAEAAMSGPDEPLVWGMRRGEKTEDGSIIWTAAKDAPGCDPGPKYYYPDGQPVLGDELMPAFMKWALLFEERKGERIVGSTKTLYGERLSTVWLGLDHQYGKGPPLIFETMLFAPDPEHIIRCAVQPRMRATMGQDPEPDDADLIAEADAHKAYIERNFPHDQLQLRYSTKSEAEDSHDRLKLQCLIPPRWRHFLLWTVGRDRTWAHYDDEDDR